MIAHDLFRLSPCVKSACFPLLVCLRLLLTHRMRFLNLFLGPAARVFPQYSGLSQSFLSYDFALYFPSLVSCIWVLLANSSSLYMKCGTALMCLTARLSSCRMTQLYAVLQWFSSRASQRACLQNHTCLTPSFPSSPPPMASMTPLFLYIFLSVSFPPSFHVIFLIMV